MFRTFLRLAPKAKAGESLKDRVKRKLELEENVRSRIAVFPHRSLTGKASEVTEQEIFSGGFTQRLMNLTKMATDGQCLSFSAPKNHWGARIVLIKSQPNDANFEVWVNPQIPQYDSTTSITPMYGMWENCVSCGVVHSWVLRPQQIHVKGWDEYGNKKAETLSGLRARLLMHEMDHLEGQTIIHRALGPEFIVSMQALSQKNLWPVNFPSAEAYTTGPAQFFDYVKNEPIIPPGMEWMFAQQSMHFNNEQIDK